jgi:hypothetical protein
VPSTVALVTSACSYGVYMCSVTSVACAGGTFNCFICVHVPSSSDTSLALCTYVLANFASANRQHHMWFFIAMGCAWCSSTSGTLTCSSAYLC